MSCVYEERDEPNVTTRMCWQLNTSFPMVTLGWHKQAQIKKASLGQVIYANQIGMPFFQFCGGLQWLMMMVMMGQ